MAKTNAETRVMTRMDLMEGVVGALQGETEDLKEELLGLRESLQEILKNQREITEIGRKNPTPARVLSFESTFNPNGS